MARGFGALCGLLIGAVLLAAGCTSGTTFSLYEENDFLALDRDSDQHYTQGLRAAWMYPTEKAPALARRIAGVLPVPGATTEAIGVVIGQEIYTPENIERRSLIRSDRPYGGWLYAGLVIANVEWDEDGPVGDDLDSYEFDVGIVGRRSYAEQGQSKAHEIFGARTPRGWGNQLEEELGLVFHYERRDRRFAFGHDGISGDLITGIGGSLGNVFTQAQVSALARLGWRVPRDFGVNTIHRSAAEVAPADEIDGLRAYLFAGVEGRAVAHNIFLDGNTFRDSHDVDRDPWVGEAMAGVAIAYGNFRLTFSQVRRSSEFREQPGSQEFGSIGLEWIFDFPRDDATTDREARD